MRPVAGIRIRNARPPLRGASAPVLASKRELKTVDSAKRFVVVRDSPDDERLQRKTDRDSLANERLAGDFRPLGDSPSPSGSSVVKRSRKDLEKLPKHELINCCLAVQKEFLEAKSKWEEEKKHMSTALKQKLVGRVAENAETLYNVQRIVARGPGYTICQWGASVVMDDQWEEGFNHALQDYNRHRLYRCKLCEQYTFTAYAAFWAHTFGGFGDFTCPNRPITDHIDKYGRSRVPCGIEGCSRKKMCSVDSAKAHFKRYHKREFSIKSFLSEYCAAFANVDQEPDDTDDVVMECVQPDSDSE